MTIAGDLEPIAGYDNTTVVVGNGRMIDATTTVYGAHLYDDANFTLNGSSTLTGSPFACIDGDGDGGLGMPTINVIGSTLTACGKGITYRDGI